MTPTQVKQLDKLYSKKVRERGSCDWCGIQVPPFETHHINYRRYKNTRWDLRNLLNLCPTCHRNAHKHRIYFEEWCLTKLGLKTFYELKTKAFQIKKLSYYEVLKELND